MRPLVSRSQTLTGEEGSAEHKGPVPVLAMHELPAQLEAVSRTHVVVQAIQVVHIAVLNAAMVDNVLLHCDLEEGGCRASIISDENLCETRYWINRREPSLPL